MSSSSRILFVTVVLPEPVPPAIPIMSGCMAIPEGEYVSTQVSVVRIYAINQELSTFCAIDKERLFHDHHANA